ncbi:DUF4288 domain-containing protein [Actinopolyspora erythraea]|uniref:DUF4288 domain-containing protein n=1 Tax=Actinopolyspora erythraea TaxID=414996 RepID=A0A099D1J6_9ACTN|nr:DUF4288 domain-containing protein [Actinopolyspora erythraea]ASU79876.1 DUF4288 domain-containing protein [Actinopolyspora erythraea]KGI79692.1 hypothetical protein IL38_21830 [Actinopolyspora erythraea]
MSNRGSEPEPEQPRDMPPPVELPEELVEGADRSINIGGDPTPGGRSSAFASEEPDAYVAVLVTESTSDSPDFQPLYEESFVLLTAHSEEEALEKAREYGKQQEISYHNEHQQLVTWRLKHVVEVKQVEDATFDDGSELYSRFFRDYARYRSFEPTLEGEEP